MENKQIIRYNTIQYKDRLLNSNTKTPNSPYNLYTIFQVFRSHVIVLCKEKIKIYVVLSTVPLKSNMYAVVYVGHQWHKSSLDFSCLDVIDIDSSIFEMWRRPRISVNTFCFFFTHCMTSEDFKYIAHKFSVFMVLCNFLLELDSYWSLHAFII